MSMLSFVFEYEESCRHLSASRVKSIFVVIAFGFSQERISREEFSCILNISCVSPSFIIYLHRNLFDHLDPRASADACRPSLDHF